MRVEVVIAVVELRERAESTLKEIRETLRGKNPEGLGFMLVCSRGEDVPVIKKIFETAEVPVSIRLIEGAGANTLRATAKKSVADYIFFHDCDDTADYAEIMAQANAIANEPHDRKNSVVCFNAFVCEENGKKRLLFKNRKEGEISGIEELPKQLWGKLIPVSALREVTFPEMKFAQDWFVSVMLWTGMRHTFVDKPIYNYRKNDQSLADPKEDTPRDLMLTQSTVNRQLSLFKKKLSRKDHDYLAINIGDMLGSRLKRFGLGRESEKLTLRRFLALDMHTRLIYLRKKTGLS